MKKTFVLIGLLLLATIVYFIATKNFPPSFMNDNLEVVNPAIEKTATNDKAGETVVTETNNDEADNKINLEVKAKLPSR